ncbi:hypothetical protein M422DRAFT_151671 [Sphaerobolus stellatus SS14]|nr:hypothetical protein M422DRAFT_151671 [Sphaerobolus stellatus SS14]
MHLNNLGRYILSFILLQVVAGQDLSVPSTWREDDTTLPRANRTAVAQAGIDQILPQLNSATGEFNGVGFWQSGNIWSAMALKDLIAGTTTNQARVTSNLHLVASLHSGFYETHWWATAAIYGFRAYKDSSLLDLAIATWNTATQYVITSNDASVNSIPTKNFTIPASCNGSTMAGGVFWQTTNSDTNINAITTGLYMTVSAYLAEATEDLKYLDAATLSQQFIVNHLYANSLALDTISGRASDNCALSAPLFTYNSGKFVEGLSIISALTGNTSTQNLMVATIAAATHSLAWQGSDGIITEGSDSPESNDDGKGFKAIYIRGLYESFSRNPSNTDLRILIHSYIDVQYNALLDLASSPSSNIYSPAWHGPPQGFTTWGQLAALDVLNSAIGANSN